MNMLTISVPSKTFLLGEYVALKGGPTLLLTTEPRFTLIVQAQKENKLNFDGIHPESPAGRLMQAESNFFSHYQLRFVDPYQGLGGFGASTAQFVMLSGLKSYVQSETIKDNELLNDYLQFAWSGVGTPPSGADLIAQRHGGVCAFHKIKEQCLTFSWPFSDIDYGLIHTGNKLATHEHLKELADLNTDELEKIVQNGIRSLEKNDSKSFIEAISNYASALQAQGLVHTATRATLKQLLTHPDIFAAKGCGALGADVILILFSSKNQSDIVLWIKEKNLNMINYGRHASTGIEIYDNNTHTAY